MKKILNILLSLLLTTMLFGCSGSKVLTMEKKQNALQGELSGKTVILHTNDIHGGFIPDGQEDQDGGLEGYAAITTLKKQYEEKGANVILVDDGDFSQGSVYVSLNKGAAAAELMEKTGYDIVGLGNHEFDYDLEQLHTNLDGRSFKAICSNVTKDGTEIFDPEVIVKAGKLKVGFFSLLTPETQTKTNPNNVAGLTFCEKDSLYEVAQKEADLLSKEADIVICLAHLGVDASSQGNQSYDIYSHTTGIDFIIDGHSHTVMESGENGEPIQSTGTKCANVGVIVIDNKTKTIEDNYLVPTVDIPADEEVLDASMVIMKEIDEKYGSIFANSDVELNGVKAEVRSMETNLGDLISDACLWKVISKGSIGVADENVVSITNGGNIRASVAAGGISMKDIHTVLPFGNTITVNYVSGKVLLEVLEASTFSAPESIGGFPQVAGIVYSIDTTVAYDAGEEYPDSTYLKPNSIGRVTIESINGKPFDIDGEYAVVANNFLAAGGDTYYALKESFDAGDGFDTGISQDDAVIEYITDVLQGKIGEQYALPQGRITVIQ